MGMGLGMGIEMDWLALALLAGGAGWAGYVWQQQMAAAAAPDPDQGDQPPGDDKGYWGAVGGAAFGSGAAGPRPDFAMGYQPWQTGGTFAPITGGSIGY